MLICVDVQIWPACGPCRRAADGRAAQQPQPVRGPAATATAAAGNHQRAAVLLDLAHVVFVLFLFSYYRSAPLPLRSPAVPLAPVRAPSLPVKLSPDGFVFGFGLRSRSVPAPYVFRRPTTVAANMTHMTRPLTLRRLCYPTRGYCTVSSLCGCGCGCGCGFIHIQIPIVATNGSAEGCSLRTWRGCSAN